MSRGRDEQGQSERSRVLGVFGARPLLLALASAFSLILLVSPPAFASPPVISRVKATHVTTTSATLEADINPGGKATSYHFEYGLADCASNPCTSVPSPEEGELPGGAIPVEVSAEIKGLTPGTTYHFRVVAKNSEGEVKSPDRTFTTHLLPPVFPTCLNDALRGGPSGKGPGLRLPDCRAYEQASPNLKNGTSLLGELSPLRAALGGQAISYESSSGIPGAEGAQEFPYYLSSRGSSDWSTQGLFPNANAGQRAGVTGWSSDHAWAYVTAGNPVVNQGAYLARSSADGSLTPIVDYFTGGGELNPQFAGASLDGSKVFFESALQIPSITSAPGKTNLYAWDQESGELSLAGVLPGEEIPEGGSFAGPYDWVLGTNQTTRATGGATRNYYTQDDHAISETGDRVFFTAGKTGQLYLREDPTSGSATTVHVSASQKTNGTGPGGKDAAGTQPAAFQTASADGSVAFLTSSEKLTNDATTGTEPTSFPTIAQAEIDGDNPNLGFLPNSTSQAGAVFGMAADSEFIYWADPELDSIGRAKLSGAEPDPEFIEVPEIKAEPKPGVFEDVEPNPQYVTVDGTHIYWSNAGALNKNGIGQIGKGTIGRAKLNGTEVDAEYVTGASNPLGVAVNATHVFWANGAKIDGGKGTIGRAKLDSSEINQNFVAIIGINSVPKGLTLNSTHLYWTLNTDSNGFLMRASPDGSEQKFTFVGEANMAGIALDSEYVYWSNPGTTDAIGRAKLDLSSPEQEFIPDAGKPKGLALNATNILWSANQEVQPNPGNDLYRYEVEGGELTDIVVDDDPNGAEVRGVLGAAQDGSHLYFAANGDLDGTGPATPGDCSGPPVGGSGECNLYHWEEDGSTKGAITFVARLDSGGGQPGDAANWAATPTGIFPTFLFQRTARVSVDGTVLLFRSQSKLTGYDNEGTPHFYRYDSTADSLACLSCNPAEEAPSGEPTLGSLKAFLISAGSPASTLTRNLSADGERFFFESTDALVAEDTNGAEDCPPFGSANQNFPACRDPYMWEAENSGTCETPGGCLYLLSTGKSPEPSFFADADTTGEDAFLLTSSQLVVRDRDQLFDVYDARVEGGLQAQNEPPVEFCESVDGCHDPVPPHPDHGSPGSNEIGPPDPPATRKGCPKGKRKAKVKGKGRSRCVAKRKGKGKAGKRQRRDAGKTRGAGR